MQQMREDGVAVFRNLVFPHGSRVKTVNIRFAQEVHPNLLSRFLGSES